MDGTHDELERLRRRIQELERLTAELLCEREADDRLDFAWSGNLGHWYLDFTTGTVVFNPLKVQAIGFSMDELPAVVPYSFFTRRLHHDDLAPTMEAMRRNMRGESPVYEVEYRIQAKDGTWRWFYDRGRVTRRGDDGSPLMASGIVFDITERMKERILLESDLEALRQETETDGLTGALNWRGAMAELDRRIADARLGGRPLSVIAVDVDHFKEINDAFGHPAGDRVLQEVASRIRGLLRGPDAVGRHGGDEFLVILPNATRENAVHVAERIRSAISGIRLDDGASPTLSLGVAELRGEDRNDLLAAADRNLYASKQAGRDRVSS